MLLGAHLRSKVPLCCHHTPLVKHSRLRQRLTWPLNVAEMPAIRPCGSYSIVGDCFGDYALINIPPAPEWLLD
jgi:hypothetical protein